MKIHYSITVNLPRARVIELFDNVENLKEWQDGFYSFRPLEGEKGKTGSTAEMVYLIGKSQSKMIIKETILDNSFPDYFLGKYEHEHIDNIMKNTFTDLGDKTRIDVDVHYTNFKGLVVKIMKLLMPGMFKKQVQKWYDQFKVFAENNPES